MPRDDATLLSNKRSNVVSDGTLYKVWARSDSDWVHAAGRPRSRARYSGRNGDGAARCECVDPAAVFLFQTHFASAASVSVQLAHAAAF